MTKPIVSKNKNKPVEIVAFECEEIFIGEDVYITIIDAKNGRVKIGIEAPDDVRINRGEKIKSSCEGLKIWKR